ncbi:alcohol dehydrogenase catalytic domain-containing protein [Rhodococcus fascians]|nr:alcohol dehydrogenase catalytic domain-containing protein [Rhodococcus fascians]MBY4235885.1 alcohol dehydrogenase catalytic domain-containing protein [Rhodococcus fascians]MBY4251576.1 alcohol dehydrogenase catalytic domain-containing protein [Rhodococcus fascians]MBY4267231.1 alcohol dehydrogenase catalytic domain-containing protein [Rhodococcus fascians]
MKAVVWHGVGDIRLDEVTDPRIEQPTDAIVRVTTSAICGTDLHLVRGTMPGMVPGTVVGHEAVGVVQEVGSAVRGFAPGDRVVVGSTVACGACSYCRAGYFAQCDTANPNGAQAGTCFFGGPESTGPVNGLQAELARIPYAATTLVKVPDAVSDEQAIMVSDVLPTGYFGAVLARVRPGNTVLVLGAGAVGQCAVASAKLQGASRVIVVDGIDSRLEIARRQNAEPVNFNVDDPVATVLDLTGGIGVDRVIDAVGVDAQRPTSGPALDALPVDSATFDAEQRRAGPGGNTESGQWLVGDAPTLAARWSVRASAKAGTIGMIGVYPPTFDSFPIGEMMNKNITVQSGNCNHRRYIPGLLGRVARGDIDPTPFVTQHVEPTSMIDAYETFDRREDGWLKTTVPM